MKTAVLLKQVEYICARTGSDPGQCFVSDADRVIMNNPPDEAALEMAVSINKTMGKGEIWVLCLGEVLNEYEARRALALGADHFVFLNHESWRNLDSWGVSGVLARAVQKISAELLLCGSASLDRNMGEVGAFTAARLSIPYINNVINLKPQGEGSSFRINQALGRGDHLILEANPPLAAGMAIGACEPGYPSLKSRRAAGKKEIKHWGPDDLPSDESDDRPRLKTGRILSPRRKTRPIPLPDGRQNAYERIDKLLSGAAGVKKNTVLKGEPRELARSLVEFLEERRLMPHREVD